jgi:3-deoxy-manno-octulosonate cytidylyltransferase (CMP-KDO synthetase)
MSRISEVINKNSPKIIYILFGDELYLKEQEISNFIKFVELQNKDSCWHLLTNIMNSDRNDLNVVKCQVNKKKEVKDFSRKYKKKYNYKCVGLFAFRREVLINYNKYKKSNREIKMKVEQFKLLDNDIKIKSLIIKNIQNSINSVKDLKSGN